MAWSSPRTWVTGETVTSVMLNEHVRDEFRELYHRIGRGTAAADVSSSTATWVTAVDLTVTALAAPHYVIAIVPTAVFTTAGAMAGILVDNTTRYGITSPTYANAGSLYFPLSISLGAGSRNLKLQVVGTAGGGVGTLAIGTNGPGLALEVWEKGGA